MANNGWLGQHALPTKLEEANVSQLRNQVNNIQNQTNNRLKKGNRQVRVRLSLNGHVYEATQQWNMESDLTLDMGSKTVTLPCAAACSTGCSGGCSNSCSGCGGACGGGCSGCSGPGGGS